MSKGNAVRLGDYFDNYVEQQIKTGRFSSVNEVVTAALRLFEDQENKKKILISELEKGEQSGFLDDFDRHDFLNKIHAKYSVKQ